MEGNGCGIRRGRTRLFGFIICGFGICRDGSRERSAEVVGDCAWGGMSSALGDEREGGRR